VQFVWNLCKEKSSTSEGHVYVLATSMPSLRMVLDNLTDASDYWTMTDKVRAKQE